MTIEQQRQLFLKICQDLELRKEVITLPKFADQAFRYHELGETTLQDQAVFFMGAGIALQKMEQAGYIAMVHWAKEDVV
jgi:hypothetical protein